VHREEQLERLQSKKTILTNAQNKVEPPKTNTVKPRKLSTTRLLSKSPKKVYSTSKSIEKLDKITQKIDLID